MYVSGLKTALIEGDDFASGTSSRSTKLIHGGVRYLQKAILGVCSDRIFVDSRQNIPIEITFSILFLGGRRTIPNGERSSSRKSINATFSTTFNASDSNYVTGLQVSDNHLNVE